jgi:hypothetical protein
VEEAPVDEQLHRLAWLVDSPRRQQQHGPAHHMTRHPDIRARRQLDGCADPTVREPG